MRSIIRKLVADSVECPAGKEIVLANLYTSQPDFRDTYALMTAAEIEQKITLREGISEQRAVAFHGRELVNAVRYVKPTKVRRYAQKYKKYLRRNRVELSFRANGHVLLRLWQEMNWQGFVHTTKYGWQDIAIIGEVEPSSIQMARAWEELGYIVKIHKGKWVEAEKSVAILKRLGED